MVKLSLPFKEIFIEETEDAYVYKRLFDKNLNDSDLYWHKDKEDREIILLKGEGWYIQKDNSIPVLIEKNKLYFIDKNVWHRLINRKYSDLAIIIRKKK